MPTLEDQQYDAPELSGEEVDARFNEQMGQEFPDGLGDAPEVSPGGGGRGKSGGKGGKAGKGGQGKSDGSKAPMNKEDAALKAAEHVPGAGKAAKKFNDLDKNKGQTEKQIDKAVGKGVEAGVAATGVGAPAAKMAGKVVEKVGTKRMIKVQIGIWIAAIVIMLWPIIHSMLILLMLYQFIKNPLKAIWDGNPVVAATKSLISLDKTGVSRQLAHEVEVKDFSQFTKSAVAAPAGSAPKEGTLEWKYAQIDWEKSKYQTVDQTTQCRVDTKEVVEPATGKTRSVIEKIYYANNPDNTMSEESKALCLSKVYPIFNTMMRSKFLREGINKEIGLRYNYAEQGPDGNAPDLNASPSPSASPVASSKWRTGFGYLKQMLIDEPLKDLQNSVTAIAAPAASPSGTPKPDPYTELKKKLREKTLNRIWKAEKESVDPDGSQAGNAAGTSSGGGKGFDGAPMPSGAPGDVIGTGKISEFGGPGDYQSGMACIPGGSQTLYEQGVYFAAMRDHSLCKQWVDIEYNGKHVQAQILDWGPATSTGRLIDVSPHVMQALGADTDNSVTIRRFNAATGSLPNSRTVPANFAVNTPTAVPPQNLLAAQIDSGNQAPSSPNVDPAAAKAKYALLNGNYKLMKGLAGPPCSTPYGCANPYASKVNYHKASESIVDAYSSKYGAKFPKGDTGTRAAYLQALSNLHSDYKTCWESLACSSSAPYYELIEAAGAYAQELLGLEAAALGLVPDSSAAAPAPAPAPAPTPPPPLTTIPSMPTSCDKDFVKTNKGEKESNPVDYSVKKVVNDLLCEIDPQDIKIDEDIAKKFRDLGKKNSKDKQMADIICRYSLYILETSKSAPLDNLKKTQKDRIASMINAGFSHVTYADTQATRPLLLEEMRADFYKMSDFASAATYHKTYYGTTNGISPQSETLAGSAVGMDMLGVHPEYPIQKAVRQLAGNCSDFLGNNETGKKDESGDKISQIVTFYPQMRDQLQALPYYNSEAFKSTKPADDAEVGLDDVLLAFAKAGTNVSDSGTEDGPQNFNRMHSGIQAYMYAYSLAMGGNLISESRALAEDIKTEGAIRERDSRLGMKWRLFDIDNPRSLASRLGAATIAEPKQIVKNIASVFGDLFGPLRNLGSAGGSLSYFVSGDNNSAMADNSFGFNFLKLEPATIPDAVINTDPIENGRYIEKLKETEEGDKKVKIDIWYVPYGASKELDPNKGDHTIKEWFGIWDACFSKFIPGELALDDDKVRECQPLFGVDADQDTSEGGKLALAYKTYHYNNLMADAMLYLSDPSKEDETLYASSSSGAGAGGDSGIAGVKTPPNLGPAQSNGYYQMPEPATPGLYTFNGGTPPSQRCGSKELVSVIYTVAEAWKQKYPESPIMVGDLNASGHASHKKGVDVDIYTSDRSAADTGGDAERSKVLGRMFADTGVIKMIFYNDVSVQSDFNSYVASKGLPGIMKSWPNHNNHFHVRIDDKYAGPVSESCSG